MGDRLASIPRVGVFCCGFHAIRDFTCGWRFAGHGLFRCGRLGTTIGRAWKILVSPSNSSNGWRTAELFARLAAKIRNYGQNKIFLESISYNTDAAALLAGSGYRAGNDDVTNRQKQRTCWQRSFHFPRTRRCRQKTAEHKTVKGLIYLYHKSGCYSNMRIPSRDSYLFFFLVLKFDLFFFFKFFLLSPPPKNRRRRRNNQAITRRYSFQ